MAGTPVARRKQPPTPEIIDAELLDLTEQIRLGVRVDARVVADTVQSTVNAANQAAPPVKKDGNYHLRPAETHLFRPLGEGHGDRRRVPVANVPTLIRAGWTTHCPYCGKRNCTQELNTCEGQEKKLFTHCPVCGKTIQDEIEGDYTVAEPAYSTDEETGELVLVKDEYEITIAPNLTAQERIRGRLAEHMRTFHPSAARQYGFVQVPTAPDNRVNIPFIGGDRA